MSYKENYYTAIPVLRTISRLRNSISKRLFWRKHLLEACDDIAFLKKELVTPEMLMVVPLVFRGKGFFRSLDLKQNMGELLGLVNELRNRPLENVCEIGTFKGGTLFIWCQMAEEGATVISIDLPGGAFGGGYNQRSVQLFNSFKKNRQRLECLRGDSHSKEVRQKFTDTLGDNQLDFLFIDGDHSYAGVKQDFEDYSPFVKKAGSSHFTTLSSGRHSRILKYGASGARSNKSIIIRNS